MMKARNSHSLRAICLLFAVAALCLPAGAAVIYVDADAAGANDGASWASAHPYLQDALARARDVKGGAEIRVAGGVYRPDQGKGQSPGDVHATFELLDYVSIAGGYAGAGAVDPDARDIAAHETILSGDLAGDDGPDFANYTNNAQVVVTSTFNAATAVLDGVTVTGGAGWSGPGMSCYGSAATVIDCSFRANQSIGREGGYGGAVFNSEGTPTFERCTFEGNWALADGGAIWNQSRGQITLVKCAFIGNYATYRGGAVGSFTSGVDANDCVFTGNVAGEQGGALYGYQTRHVLTGCTFTGNRAPTGGGGIYNLHGPMSIAGCTFTANISYEGGGIYNDSAAPVAVTGSLLAGNVATGSGGGMYNFCDSCPKLTNCTFADNRSPEGAGLAAGVPVMHNCIVWNEDPDATAFLHLGDGPAISYSCIQGGWPGVGNIDADPRFAQPGFWDANDTPDDPNDDLWIAGDYHLKSRIGRWDPNDESWVADDVASPCIDAGDPKSRLGAEPFPNGGIINMGAYGGTAKASKSDVGPVSTTNVFTFVPGLSTLFQTGGFAGVHWPHAIEGQFTLSVDFTAGTAWFSEVDAVGTYAGPPARTLDVGEALNMTALAGSIEQDGSIRFTGEGANETAIELTLTFKSDSVQIRGNTTPPPGSADFFILEMDAVALQE
ncbi:MAG: right-handed parallel beta-helix repeat-containing protein [Sedimentisphaerales bacterium]|nr:right-handed parallel beta-helix repeat-containing protein [Sedimentisphaerales bacterium]